MQATAHLAGRQALRTHIYNFFLEVNEKENFEDFKQSETFCHVQRQWQQMKA